jgi:mitochondrial fission protein ELM1
VTQPLTAWVLTDGKAGDEVQCVGVAEAMGLQPEIRRVAPRGPWVWFMPWGSIDPAEAPDKPGSPLAPPFPDLAIASGRRAAPYLRAVKRASQRRTFTVFLKDPRSGAGTADFIWVPEHDRLRGPNVLATLTSPHRVSRKRLAEAREGSGGILPPLAAPRAAVLLGGDSRHYQFEAADVRRLAAQLETLAGEGVQLMATASRRSPPALVAAVKALTDRTGGFLWNGSGENPYLAMLATADVIVVTADSVNMVGEACATGRPVLVFEPTARKTTGARKIQLFLKGLRDHGAVRLFQGHLESYAYVRIDSTPVIADAILAAFARHEISLKRPG